MSNSKNYLGLALTLGLALVAAGCSDDDKGGTTNGANDGKAPFDAGSDPNRNKVVVGSICQRLAEIQCAGEEYCCEAPGRTKDACIAAQKKACDDPPAQLDAVAGQAITGFDAARAEAAFTEFETLASQCSTSIAAHGIAPDGLRGIVQGTVAAGGTCTPTNMGESVQIAAALASCSNPATQACLPSSADWICTPLADAGGTCFTDVNCKTGLYCDNPTLDLTGGTCATRKAAGATCALSNECASFSCKGSVCADAGVQTAYCLQ